MDHQQFFTLLFFFFPNRHFSTLVTAQKPTKFLYFKHFKHRCSRCPQCHFSSNEWWILAHFGQFLASISLKQKKKKKKGAFSLAPLTLKSQIDAASVTAGAAKHSGSNEDHLAKVEISQRPRLQPSPRYVQEQSSVINTPVITPPVCMWPYVSACTVSELAGTCTNIRCMSAMSLLVKGHHHCSPVRGEDSLSALSVKSVWSFSWRPCHPRNCVSNRALGSLPLHWLFLLKQRDDIISPHLHTRKL